MGRRKEWRRRDRETTPGDSRALRQRIDDTLARGEFRAARELAKDLVKREPTDEHRRCLFEATLGRAAQLRSTGHLPDAVMLLRSVIEDLRYAPDFAERLAGDLIRAGDWKTADEVSRRIADPAAPARLERLRTDAAVLLGEAGLARLSEELRTEAAAVLRGLA